MSIELAKWVGCGARYDETGEFCVKALCAIVRLIAQRPVQLCVILSPVYRLPYLAHALSRSSGRGLELTTVASTTRLIFLPGTLRLPSPRQPHLAHITPPSLTPPIRDSPCTLNFITSHHPSANLRKADKRTAQRCTAATQDQQVD